MRHDLIVIGGGSAGLVAAHLASKLGARVALVEQAAAPGGDCLWTGCVPSKALISIAGRAHAARHSRDLGVSASHVEIDFSRVMASVRAAQAVIEPHDSFERLENSGVTTIRGRASLAGRGRVVVMHPDGAEQVVTARHVLIAAGSQPVVPPIAGIESVKVMTSDDVWALEQLPARLLVLGGGAIGCELGQAFARLGSSVTLVEAAPRLLLHEEPIASELVGDALIAEAIDVRCSVRVERFEPGIAVLDDGSRVRADVVLVAAGRRSRADDVDPGGLLARMASGAIQVDDRQRTSVRGVWAAGDVTGQLPFTHAAGSQGVNVVLNALFGTRRRFDAQRVPWVTFTSPEVGRVGLTQDQAEAQLGDRVRIVDLPLSRVDRAVAAHEGPGLVRLVTDRGRRVVGATVVAEHGGEVMSSIAAQVGRRGGVGRLAFALHPYPTFGEATQRAALTLRQGSGQGAFSQWALRRVIAMMSRVSG